jgi:hypothetical protein
MSLNETATRNVWQHYFPEPGGGGGGECGTNWPIEVATLCEFYENDRFLTTSCDPYKGNTPRLVHTFHYKKDTRDGF